MGIIKAVLADLNSIKDRDPSVRNKYEILLTHPGVHAVLIHRLSHDLYKHGHFFTARVLSQIARFFTGIEIHPGAKIGKGLFIDHGAGVVIGETAIVGKNCTIYQGVTLGGTGKQKGKRHPTLANNVLVGAGAKILGPVVVGNCSKVASGAVVLESIPPCCTAVGVPARIVKKNGVKVGYSASRDMDQIHITDPVAQEICKLNFRIEKLEEDVTGRRAVKMSDKEA